MEPNQNESTDTASGEAAGRVAAIRGLVNLCISRRDPPVIAIRRYRRDIRVKKQSSPNMEEKLKGTKRGEIKEFSQQSRLNLLHTVKNCDADFHSMITVTYPSEFPRTGPETKMDLNRLTKWLRRHFEEIQGIWFLEFQRRGAPHYHVLVSIDLCKFGELTVKRRSRMRGHKCESYQTHKETEDSLSAAWYRIVGSGDQKHLRAGSSWEVLEDSEAAMKYAAAHAAKPHQKDVPEEFRNVGRFWGKVGVVRVEAGEWEPITTAQLFEKFGHEVLSSRGRVKRFLWDEAEKEV